MRTGLQFVLAIDDDLLAGLQTRINQSFTLFDSRHLDGSRLDRRIVFDHERVRALRTPLDY